MLGERSIGAKIGALLLAAWLGGNAPVRAAGLPSLDERIETLEGDFVSRFQGVAERYGLTLPQIMQLSDALGDDAWGKLAKRLGVPQARQVPLWQELETLPHKRHDDLSPYNLLNPAKDRWGLTVKEGELGWQKYGGLIEQVAIEQEIDPLILGAYVWTESNFDAQQDTRQRGLYAIGLASIQAQDYRRLGGTLEERIARLKRDPYLNLTLAAREFRAKWNPQDMFGTVMDVWYPAWRRQGRIPNLGTAYAYMQLFSNRYFHLMTIMGGSSS